ncbi:MAG: ROK family protein [Chloroflexi bacterium]|nr:ROK family protein [Chloroflexota bacterium]
MKSYVAVDLGGTNLRAARYTPDGELLTHIKHPTLAKDSNESVLDRVVHLVQEVLPANDGAHDEVEAIAIGAPGPSNPFTGVVYNAPNLPGWVNLPLREIMQSRFNLPVELGNDANLAALAEWKFGAGRGHNDLVYLTISTGIGGGVISSGRLVVGANGLAAEMGHVVVAPDGPVCGCGQRGHLEAMASGPAIGRTARARLRGGAASSILELVDGHLKAVTAQHVGQAAKDGDPFALELLNEAGTFIGRAVADFMHIFNPSIVILGGGVAINVGELLLQPVRAAIRDRAMSDIYYINCPVTTAQLGDDVGLLGALALALETHPV